MERREGRKPLTADYEYPPGGLAAYPPPDRWDDWVEYDPKAWPKKVERRFMLVPTVCFNCEAACGLVAYVDKETFEIRKLEGNPLHPASRGRNCAKGPATINQVKDPERILYPLKREGKRGEGGWARVSWDEVLNDLAGRIRRALLEGRHDEVVYHVGRPGEKGFMDRVLRAWGIDGHNSHTNVCSSGARAGYAFWMRDDRPSPDYANARFVLLLSSHLESGHFFNPHAQRIIESKMKGGKLAVLDPRLSNTASMADYWLPTWPGSEAAVLLAIANVLLQEELYNAEFLRRWVNWEDYLREIRVEPTFPNFIKKLKEEYGRFTPEFAEEESGVPAHLLIEVAREIGRAGTAFSAHVWRAAAAGNLGGWAVARALFFLNVLTGSVGTVGGVSPNYWDEFVPDAFLMPPLQKKWNELMWPKEYPLAHHEMSFLLPHFLKEGRAKVDVYFTRVYNPVWTNPDGFAWIDVLKDESKVGLHVALTPTWSETAWFADYVLPMGHAPERHDIHSYETHAARWIGFRQPVVRVAKEKMGHKVEYTYETNPGEVWEENEFWIELSWRIDPDGGLGIRKYFESPSRPGQKITVEEYYRWIFENGVPGLKKVAAEEGLTPTEYMRKYGAFAVEPTVYARHEERFTSAAERPANTIAGPIGHPEGVLVDGERKLGFNTPSGKLEFFSKTLKEWGWPECAIPCYFPSHVRKREMKQGEFVLLPTFRLPTMIHTRSGNAKWLNEISHTNPVWIHTSAAERLGVTTGDLVKVSTDIGYFVNRIWVTEAIAPGVVACSHHMGRWRLAPDTGGERWSTAQIEIREEGTKRIVRQIQGIRPFASSDPDSSRIWWSDAGVHQNLTFPVQPDPVSGSHCWHQRVRVEKAGPKDRYGDIVVDTAKGFEVYRKWLAKAKPAPGPGNLRRPLWLLRPVRPDPSAYQLP